MEMSEIGDIINSGKTLEELAKTMSWQYFENLCISILEENGYTTEKHFRFKDADDKQHEIDILASKAIVRKHSRGSTRTIKYISIDCKHWSVGRTSALKKAAKKQEERVKKLKKTENFKRKLNIPMIVTLFQENVTKESEVFIVPVFKLNSLLSDVL